jgi:hypothetical protein
VGLEYFLSFICIASELIVSTFHSRRQGENLPEASPTKSHDLKKKKKTKKATSTTGADYGLSSRIVTL